MAFYIQTRGLITDYYFVGDAPLDRWWSQYENYTSFEGGTIIVEQGRLYIGGIPSQRRDRVGTKIRYTLVVDDFSLLVDDELALLRDLMMSVISPANVPFKTQKILDEAFANDKVDEGHVNFVWREFFDEALAGGLYDEGLDSEQKDDFGQLFENEVHSLSMKRDGDVEQFLRCARSLLSQSGEKEVSLCVYLNFVSKKEHGESLLAESWMPKELSLVKILTPERFVFFCPTARKHVPKFNAKPSQRKRIILLMLFMLIACIVLIYVLLSRKSFI